MNKLSRHQRTEFDDHQVDHFRSLCEMGDVLGVIDFLDKGFPVNKMDFLGHTGLHVAAKWNQVDVMAVLIERGIPLNMLDTKKNTPLHQAASSGSLDACRMLLDLGADANAKNNSQETPFMSSLRNLGLGGSSLACSELLFNRSPLNLKGHDFLHICSTPEQFQWLLDRGADPNEKNQFGMTPLHALCNKSAHVEPTFRIAMNHGADLHARDRDGDTPLHAAAKFGNDQLCRLFLDAGADPDLTNKNDQTPLMCALNPRQVDRQRPFIWSLIAFGAKTERTPMPDEFMGMTPVVAAIHLGLTPLVVRLANEDPATPLHELNKLATDMGKEETSAAIQSMMALRKVQEILSENNPKSKEPSP
jgi:ankyrin repeat protein